MSLLALSQSREKASTIVDIFKSVASGKISNADGIRGVQNALKGLSSEQVKSIATSGLFDQATARNLMSLKGLDKEAIDTALSTGKFTKALDGGITPLKNLGKAAGEFGEQLLSGLKEIGLFLATNPIGWIIDVAAAMAIMYAAYKKFNTSAKEANENMQNAFDESKSQLKSVKEQKDTVDQLSESYEKLSKGVNTATNENISLSTDSYKEYLDTCNQIADMYPDLVTGYDAQGNAILSLKGNVDQLTESYKQAQQEAYATAYLGSEDENGNRTGTAKDRQKAFEYATNTYDNDDNVFKAIGKNAGNAATTQQIQTTTSSLINEYKKMIDMSDKELQAYITDTSANASMTAKQFANTIADGTAESYDEVRKVSRQKLNELIGEQEDMLKNEATALEGYMKGVTDASGEALSSGYDKLTEEQQNLATSLLSSIDLTTMQAFEDSGDFAKAEQKWVDNLVSSVSTMSATAKNAYDKLQDAIASPGDLTSSGIENIDKYLTTLESELNISKDKLKDIFNLEDIFDTQTSFDNIVKQYLGTEEFDKLSSGVKKATDSVDEYGNSVKEAINYSISTRKRIEIATHCSTPTHVCVIIAKRGDRYLIAPINFSTV